MTPNDDLARWGEPPASDAELALADLLADWLDRPDAAPGADATGLAGLPAGAARDLLETSSWLDLLVTAVLEHSGLAENLPCPAATGGPAAPELRLRVRRLVGPGRYTLVASTHGRPTALRDLKRLPDDPERVALRTGDRVKVEVVCDRGGYLSVFNVGPAGTLNLLWPDDPSQPAAQPAGVALEVAGVALTPPAGQERLYAVWSRVPLSAERLAGLARPGVSTRDMQRVQEAVDELRREDWHAVLLVLEHAAA